MKIGYVAGTTGKGYVRIRVGGELFLAHRLVFLYCFGSMPDEEVDHINGVRNDNRLVNLRQVSRAENSKNKKTPKNNTSGHAGVYFDKQAKKWVAIIKVNRKNIYLGFYKEKKDAINRRLLAVREYGFHENHCQR
jgi:hypothetical protein